MHINRKQFMLDMLKELDSVHLDLNSNYISRVEEDSSGAYNISRATIEASDGSIIMVSIMKPKVKSEKR